MTKLTVLLRESSRDYDALIKLKKVLQNNKAALEDLGIHPIKSVSPNISVQEMIEDVESHIFEIDTALMELGGEENYNFK